VIFFFVPTRSSRSVGARPSFLAHARIAEISSSLDKAERTSA
jgi:hypothetical protein